MRPTIVVTIDASSILPKHLARQPKSLPDVQIPPPRLDWTKSPLARSSNGFLHIEKRLTSSRRKFKQRILRIVLLVNNCRTPLVHKALRKLERLDGNVGVFVMARRGVRAAGIHKKMFSQVNLLAGTGESPVS